MTAIEVVELCKSYEGNNTRAVNGVSFSVQEGEVTSLLGPSGCGKTTVLRCIAGLETPDAGTIRIEDHQVYGGGTRPVPPERRGLSMVFQQYALWPHMNVLENVAFGPSVRGVAKSECVQRAQRALDMVKLLPYKDRGIAKLSGGQQQRVALARSLAVNPRIVLFDEPLSNLDAKLREQMRIELIELRNRLGFAAVYVTHDQSEAIGLSNHILVMNSGVVEQIGDPRAIWDRPASAFVADFIGEATRLDATVVAAPDGAAPGRRVRVGEGFTLAVEEDFDFPVGAEVCVFLRFSSLAVSLDQPGTQPNRWPATIRFASFEGHSTLLGLAIGDTAFTYRLNRGSPLEHLAAGATVWVSIAPGQVQCFSRV
jgi:ABC-type Fe3+/spermidine/putrescine transport system ATPase subunit